MRGHWFWDFAFLNSNYHLEHHYFAGRAVLPAAGAAARAGAVLRAAPHAVAELLGPDLRLAGREPRAAHELVARHAERGARCCWLLALTSVLSISPGQTPGTPVDVSTRQGRRAVDGHRARSRQAERRAASGRLVARRHASCTCRPPTAIRSPQKLRHYIVPVAGGAPKPVDARARVGERLLGASSPIASRPGLRSLMIDVEQKQEKVKVGTGSGRPGEQAGGGAGVDSAWTSRRPPKGSTRTSRGSRCSARRSASSSTRCRFPGLMFSWGPAGSGAIAYTDRELGHLMLLDQQQAQADRRPA